MKCYSTVLVVLHWVLVLFVMIALFMGFDIASLSHELDLKVDRLVIHIIAGVLIGFAFLLRLAIKSLQPSNAPSQTNHSLAGWLAEAYYAGLYVLILSVVTSGIAMSIEVDFLSIVAQGDTIPQELTFFVSRQLHELLTRLLMVAISIHILAALYNQLILKDRLVSRMWFGKR
ncbi:cytochrome b [Salinivibrio sp. ES.052]|uniref:cytochrome b n=1 Tax=Salinivibrio sp. ES.052 TaxID=1882823 RepID=UPI0009267786|nr:cytochrome b/b6 domain-containing protein [Salinivibrio sp. ES.052]SIO32749.1 cytochrome b561 [Salinivibrio sp. ES.052]